jgi:hypothetical protein
MLKQYLIDSVTELVLKQSPNQDSNKRVHPKIIEAEISKAYDSILKTYFAKEGSLFDVDSEYFCKSYQLALKKETSGRHYCDLTVQPMFLRNNLGLRSIRPLDGDVSFVRTSENELETFRRTHAYQGSNSAFYYLSGKKIIFDFHVLELGMADEVTVKLIPSFMDFADSDNIEFPYGEKDAMLMILQAMGFRPTDNTNDNVR